MTLTLVSDSQQIPRQPAQIDPDTFTVTHLSDALKQAGVREGDSLIAEDGQTIHGFLQAVRIFFQHKPGDRIILTLRRGSAAPFDATFIIPHREKQVLADFLIPVFLNIVTPWFCILLGFLAAFRRTGDPVAYALLALLLCVSQLLKAEAALRYTWEPLFTWPMLFLDTFASGAFLVAWMWFAMLFPDPTSRHKLFPWARWVIGVPYLVKSFIIAIASTAFLHRSGSLAWLFDLVHVPSWLELAFTITLISLGAANFTYKLVQEKQPSVRRRLRWMLFGLSLGTLPVLIMFGISRIFHRDPNSLPIFVIAPIVITPFFIPLTLAYAVLVDRMFDVGVFLRQGLLASKTVTVIRGLLVIVILAVTTNVMSRKDLSTAQRSNVIAGCIIAVLLLRRAADWVRGWVDRHFFQEAVNTENLLIELSAEVRRIADPELLLRTVTERISNALHVSRVVFVPVGGAMVAGHDELLLPISAGDDLQGAFSLGPKRSEEPYSSSDIRLLESVASQTALALENGRLTASVAKEAAHRERITSELEIARKVQERLFPKAAPQVPGLDLAGHCQPAQTVGGDYYDFLATPSGGTGLAIGDVAGKGVPAALLMAGLQASLRGLTLAGVSDPADLLTKLNILIYDATPINRFATFFYGLYDPSNRLLRYSSAGHNPALLYRPASDETIWLKTRGVGLGLKRTSLYEQAEVRLQPEDCLVLYTDGVTEARNSLGDEYGEDRMVALVRANASRPAAEILEALLCETTDFVGDAPQFDDLTLIVVRSL